MQKSYLPTGNEPAAFGLRSTALPARRQLFRIACFLSSRRSGDSSLGFYAGSL